MSINKLLKIFKKYVLTLFCTHLRIRGLRPSSRYRIGGLNRHRGFIKKKVCNTKKCEPNYATESSYIHITCSHNTGITGVSIVQVPTLCPRAQTHIKPREMRRNASKANGSRSSTTTLQHRSVQWFTPRPRPRDHPVSARVCCFFSFLVRRDRCIIIIG